MANTVTRGGSFLTLSAIDTDVLASDLWPEQSRAGVPVISIDFVPGAATDKCVIREGSLTGPIIFSHDIAAANFPQGREKYFAGKPIRPCMDVSEGSYNAAALVIIQMGDA
ncbi:MAG: hypothetical protein KAS36_05120 [Anaerolineales bacterium]|nr:hypothetical protein [Anaerolineales bacterium]